MKERRRQGWEMIDASWGLRNEPVSLHIQHNVNVTYKYILPSQPRVSRPEPAYIQVPAQVWALSKEIAHVIDDVALLWCHMVGLPLFQYGRVVGYVERRGEQLLVVRSERAAWQVTKYGQWHHSRPAFAGSLDCYIRFWWARFIKGRILISIGLVTFYCDFYLVYVSQHKTTDFRCGEICAKSKIFKKFLTIML